MLLSHIEIRNQSATADTSLCFSVCLHIFPALLRHWSHPDLHRASLTEHNGILSEESCLITIPGVKSVLLMLKQMEVEAPYRHPIQQSGSKGISVTVNACSSLMSLAYAWVHMQEGMEKLYSEPQPTESHSHSNFSNLTGLSCYQRSVPLWQLLTTRDAILTTDDWICKSVQTID